MNPVSKANDTRSCADRIHDQQHDTDILWADFDPSSRSDKVLNIGKKLLKFLAATFFACTIIGIPFAVVILRDPKAEDHKEYLAFLRSIPN